MSHLQNPIDRPARCTKAELAVQVETLKRRVAELEEAAADRIRVEDALRMSEARLRAIMDHAPTEIFLVDKVGRYELINKEFERRYRLTEEQVVGKTMGEFFPADITAEFTAQDRETFETGRAIVKEQRIEYGGEMHTDLEVKFPIVDRTGDVVGVGGIATDITDRKKAEEAMQKSEQRYRALFENAPVAIRIENLSSVKACIDALEIDDDEDFAAYLDRHPSLVVECCEAIEVIGVNQAAIKLHGVDDPAVLRANVTRNLSSAAQATLKDVLLAMHRGETSLEFETFVICADGSRRDVEAHWSVVPGHEDDYSRVLFISVDITERKRAEEALRESEAMLAKAQRIGELGFSIWDEKENREIYCSRTGAEIFGVPEGTLCDDFEVFLEKVHPEDRARVKAAMGRGCEDHAGYEVEYRIVRPDGTSRTVVERTECEFDDEGMLARTVSTLQDITERKRVEDEMHRYQAELAHVSRLNMLGEMTAGLAHELNQPLAVISSYAQGCLSSIEEGKGAPETLAGALQHIVSQSARASEIIRRIRGFIRKDRRPKSRIDVNAAIGVAMELLKGEAGAHGVAVRMDLAEPSPTAVVDDIEFQQVILNLARNSIEIMGSQGLKSRELRIRTATSSRPSDEGVGQVEISVQDTGPGVPPEIRDHVFEPFFTTKSRGLGLGLSICRSILDRHGGNLWLGGDGGTGADFRFTLPLCAREGPPDF